MPTMTIIKINGCNIIFGHLHHPPLCNYNACYLQLQLSLYNSGYVITILDRFDFDVANALLICAITIIGIYKCTWHATVI
jgi:hypothetical protein